MMVRYQAVSYTHLAQEEELTDTRVVDIFAELNEEPVSEDAENDFEEK